MIRFIIFCFCVASLLLSVTSEVVKFGGCDYTDDLCEISEVRVEPCKEASRNQACRIKRGQHASIAVDYTPLIASDTLTSQPYWYNGAYIPFADMDTEGCKTTKCPLQVGVKETYDYSLNIQSEYPLATYTVRWNLTSSDLGCCFAIKLKITK